jgi:hypothetical protein
MFMRYELCRINRGLLVLAPDLGLDFELTAN